MGVQLKAPLCEELRTRINNVWIEKTAFVADDFLDGLIKVKRRTIRLVGR